MRLAFAALMFCVCLPAAAQGPDELAAREALGLEGTGRFLYSDL